MSGLPNNNMTSKEEERLVNELKIHFDYEEYVSKTQGAVIELVAVNVKELINVLQPYLK